MGGSSLPRTVGCDRRAARRPEGDGRSRRFNRPEWGAAARWSLGRHAAFRAGRPHPLKDRAPHPLTPHGGANGRATRAALAFGSAVRAPGRLLLNVGRHAGCPPAFSGWGGAAGPHCVTGPWADLSPLRAGNDLRLPRRRADRVGTVRLVVRRLDALHHVL